LNRFPARGGGIDGVGDLLEDQRLLQGRERLASLGDGLSEIARHAEIETHLAADATKARRPEIEWRAIAAFRNVLVHDYLGVDLEEIWDVVQRDVPGLKRAVESLLGTAP
jgi:hypothetical protein